MSNTAFVESLSTDPVEQALARKVMRILNDPTLDRQQRMLLVQQAQRELIRHRQRQQEETLLLEQVRALPMPKGYRVVSVQVKQGRVQVAATSPGGLTWLDAGQAPAGVAANRPPRALKNSARQARRPQRDPIAERRQELRRPAVKAAA